MGSVIALGLSGLVPSAAHAQQAGRGTPLVFDGVAVVDVERGGLLENQRVVVAGNRIRTVGPSKDVPLPQGAQVVDAKGKYLIPGLWDFHVHSMGSAEAAFPLSVANGVTGIRDAWSDVPLATQIEWRREILAGKRVGPPRQILSGPAIDEEDSCTRTELTGHVCVTSGDSADARRLVDELKAAGVDMIKVYRLSAPTYRLIAREARRVRLPFGGHLTSDGPSAPEASDQGAHTIDHPSSNGGLDTLCLERGATVERCRPVAKQFQRNDTWLVPTLIPFNHPYNGPNPGSQVVSERFNAYVKNFWADSASARGARNYLGGTAATATPPDSVQLLRIAGQVGLPVVAGTDVVAPFMQTMPPGFALHEEVAMYVAEGLTPLQALQTATLNAARFLHATDSLGTVASGKLADLVLLDANPLDDITNITLIRAVVANGRYFDRAALDQVLAEVRVKAGGKP